MSRRNDPISMEERRLKALLGKIGRLLDEAELIEPRPELVATPEPVAVSLEQAAAMLNVKPASLRDYIRSGQLRTFRLGRRVLIRRAALHSFAEAKEDASALVVEAGFP